MPSATIASSAVPIASRAASAAALSGLTPRILPVRKPASPRRASSWHYGALSSAGSTEGGRVAAFRPSEPPVEWAPELAVGLPGRKIGTHASCSGVR